MNTFPILLFLHVLSATLLIGGSTVATPLILVHARRVHSVADLRAVLSVGRPLSVINPAASLGVMVTGLALSQVLHAWHLPWVRVAVGLWVASTLVAKRVVVPHVGLLAGALARSTTGAIDSEVDRLRSSPRWAVGAAVLVANNAAILALMAMKPGLATALVLVVVSYALMALGLFALASREVRLPTVPTA